MNTRGTLVIGLGEVGIRVKQQAVKRWEQILTYEAQSAPFNAISASLLPDAAPDHVRIDEDVTQARRIFGEPLPPNIRAWADPTALDTARNKPLTRVQARLLWFANVARGSTSSLITMWTRQIRALANTGSLAVFLIADLNETFANAVLADAVYLTRAVAAQERLQMTLWAFTILPAPDAPHVTRMEGYAALRELSRLTNASSSELGYPFIYRTGHDDPITQGRLREKPFDLWYCFEGTQSEPDLSALVSAFLYEQSFSEAATFANNLSVATRKPDPLGVYVSAGNARTLALPVREYAAYAMAQNRSDVLKWLLTPPLPARVIQSVDSFLSADSSLRGRRLVNGLKEIERNVAPRTQEMRLDEWLLDNQALAQEAFAEDTRPLRASGMTFEVGNQELLFALLRIVERVGKPVSSRTLPTPSAYDQLVSLASDRHHREFEAHLVRTLTDTLNNNTEESPFAHVTAVTAALSSELAGVSTALAGLLQRRTALEKEVRLSYDTFDNAAKKLEQMYRDYSNQVQRMRHAPELRRAQIAVQTEAATYLTARRLLVLIDAANQVIEAQVTALTRVQHELAQWEKAFSAGLAAVQEHGETLPVIPTLRWVVPSLNDQWLHEQSRKAVARSSHTLWVDQITWQVDRDRITMATPEALVHPLDLRPLWNLMDNAYTDFHRSTTLLGYFQEKSLSGLLPYLTEAEQASMQVHPSINSMALWRGRLYAPASDFSEQRRLPEAIIHELNRAHGRDDANRSMIDVKLHPETDRLIYACSIDNIELQSESVTFGVLADYAAKHRARLAAFHVLSADREAVRLGDLIGRPLSPYAVAVLYDIERLRLFWVAYCLNLLGEEKSTTNSLTILFMLPDHRTLVLTYPRQTQDQAWYSAIAAFVAAHEVQGTSPFYLPVRDSPFADIGILAGQIENVWDAQGSLIDLDALTAGHAQRAAWLARARDVITPDIIRQQIEHSVIRHTMLDSFIEDVERGRSAFAQDADALVLIDLYDIGIALLKEKQRAIEDQILGWIARLPGGTLTRR